MVAQASRLERRQAAASTAQRVVMGSAVLVSSRVVSSVANVIKAAGIAKLLTPAALGVFNLVNVVLTYGGLAQLGIRSAAMRELLILEGRGDLEASQAVHRTALNLNLLLLMVYVAGVAGMAYLWGDSAQVRMGLLVCVPLLFLVTLCQWYEVRALADKAFAVSGTSQVAQAVLGGALLLGGTYMWGLTGLLLGLLLAQGLTLVLIASSVRLPIGYGVTWREGLRLLRAAAPFFIGTIAFMLLRGVDNLLVIVLTTKAEWGLYSFALMICFYPVNIANDCSRVIYQFAQERVGPNQVAQLRNYVLAPTLVGAFMLPLLAGLAHYLLPPFVKAVFPMYVPAIGITDLLFIAVFFYVVSVFHGSSLTVLNREGTTAVLRFVAAAVAGVTGVVLLRAGWGLRGAALAASAGWAAYAVCVILISARLMRVRGGELVRYLALLGAPLGYWQMGVEVAGLIAPVDPSAARALVGAFAFLALYAPALVYLGLKLNLFAALAARSWASLVLPFDRRREAGAGRAKDFIITRW